MTFLFELPSTKPGKVKGPGKTKPTVVEANPTTWKYAVVPVLGRKKSNPVSDRIISALRKSKFCSGNPIVKSLLVQNVQVCCIVIETTGFQSVKVICASVPYLLCLLSKANPKLRRLLEDEKVVSYMKFFRDTDLESLLDSVIAATVVVQNGLKACYPTLCVQLSRDALLFSQVTLKSILKALYHGLLYVFEFVWDDLGPALRSLCSQNRKIVKALTKRMPVLALAVAKGLVLFSLFCRRLIRVFMRSLKHSFRYMYDLLRRVSLDSVILLTIEYLQRLTNLVVTFATSEPFRCACKNASGWCVKYSKEFLPFLWQELLKLLKECKPLIRSCIQSIAKFISVSFAPNGHLLNLVKFCYSCKPLFLNILNWVNVFVNKLIVIFMQTKSIYVSARIHAFPHCKIYVKMLLKQLFQFFGILVKWSVRARKHFLNNWAYIPTLRAFFSDMIRIVSYISINFAVLCRSLMSEIYQPFSYPIAAPVIFEVKSTLLNATKEVLIKSSFAVKKVVPSTARALKTVYPETCQAALELLTSSRSSAVIMSPIFLQAFETVRPELLQMMMVIFRDSQLAGVEIVRVFCVASGEFVSVSRNISHELPILKHAICEVALLTSNSALEVYVSSSKARARVFKDVKKALSLVMFSAISAEVELQKTFQDIALENSDLNCVLQNLFNGFLLLIRKTSSVTIPVLSKLISNSITKSSRPSLLEYLLQSFIRLVSIAAVVRGLLSKSDIVQELFSQIFQFSEKLRYFMAESYAQCLTYFLCSLGIALKNRGPEQWKVFKYNVSQLWSSYCIILSELWLLLELFSSKSWSLTCLVTPKLWSVFKYFCQILWEQICEVSPTVWNYMIEVTPIAWNSSRETIKQSWNMHLKTCSYTWGVAVPLCSSAWSYTVDTCPKIFLVASENSKLQWKLLCDITENGWEVATSTGFSSWELFHRVVSKTWRNGLKPMTVSLFCCTGTVWTKGIMLSNIACTKTGKVVFSFYDELTGTRFFKMVHLTNGASITRGILKNCLHLSRARFSLAEPKRAVLENAIVKVKDVSSQVRRMYSNFSFEKVKNSLATTTKLPFMPVVRTYAFSQELAKKYSFLPKSCEKLLFSGSPILFIH